MNRTIDLQPSIRRRNSDADLRVLELALRKDVQNVTDVSSGLKLVQERNGCLSIASDLQPSIKRRHSFENLNLKEKSILPLHAEIVTGEVLAAYRRRRHLSSEIDLQPSVRRAKKAAILPCHWRSQSGGGKQGAVPRANLNGSGHTEQVVDHATLESGVQYSTVEKGSRTYGDRESVKLPLKNVTPAQSYSRKCVKELNKSDLSVLEGHGYNTSFNGSSTQMEARHLEDLSSSIQTGVHRRVSLPLDVEEHVEENNKNKLNINDINSPNGQSDQLKGNINDLISEDSGIIKAVSTKTRKRHRHNSGSETLPAVQRRKIEKVEEVKKHKAGRSLSRNTYRKFTKAGKRQLSGRERTFSTGVNRQLKSEISRNCIGVSKGTEHVETDKSAVSRDLSKEEILMMKKGERSFCKNTTSQTSVKKSQKLDKGLKIIDKIHETIASSESTSVNLYESVEADKHIPLAVGATTVNNVRMAKLQIERKKGSLYRRMSNDAIWNNINSKY